MPKKTPYLEIPSLDPLAKGYTVVFEKQDSSLHMQALSEQQLELFMDLYTQIQENPRKHLTALQQLQENCPNVPEIANLLAYAYLRLKEGKKAEELIEMTWKAFPDNLIARINYADQSLRQGKKERIPQIFNHCFDLHTLYPDKEAFHFNEFRGFMTTLGSYYLDILQKEKAEECYLLAFQVDPLHPSVIALEKKLFKSSWIKSFLKALQKLAGISKNP